MAIGSNDNKARSMCCILTDLQLDSPWLNSSWDLWLSQFNKGRCSNVIVYTTMRKPFAPGTKASVPILVLFADLSGRQTAIGMIVN